MDKGRADFHDDWEILGHGSDSPRSSSVETLDGNDEGMGDESGGMIKVDYFTAQGSGSYHGGHVSESGDSVGSEKLSWIDPGLDNARYGKGSATEPWSEDSGSDEERKFGEFEGKKAEEAKGEVDLYESVKSDSGIVLDAGVGVKGEVSLCESVQSEISKFGDEVMVRNEGVEVEDGDDDVRMKEEEEKENEGVTEEESRSGVAWWKVPFELVRYCVMRMSNPVWTFSVAAAVMGVVMLGRKLYRMKQKSRALQLKVAVDDKKVSQVMSRAARLNEAFSVVRRVPIIRPVLPAPGVGPWPAMSLR